eukprot:1184786-Prorocentrum_minimum.AAC.2
MLGMISDSVCLSPPAPPAALATSPSSTCHSCRRKVVALCHLSSALCAKYSLCSATPVAASTTCSSRYGRTIPPLAVGTSVSAATPEAAPVRSAKSRTSTAWEGPPTSACRKGSTSSQECARVDTNLHEFARIWANLREDS